MKRSPASGLAPFRKASFVAEDASQIVQVFKTWVDIDYTQIDCGPFSGRLDLFNLGNPNLFLERKNRTLIRHVAMANDRCTVYFIRETLAAGRCNAGELAKNTVLYCPAGSEIEVLSPPSDMGFFAFRSAALLEAAALDEHPLASRPNLIATLSNDQPGPLHRLANLLTGPESPHRGDLVNLDYLERIVLSHALDALTREPSAHHPGWTRSRRVTSAAREFIAGAPDQPLTVLDVCQAIRVSRRTLQGCFMDIYGVSPLTYLRRIRLNQARRDLLSAPAGATVTEIAMRWGFLHLARFAQDYRLQFGELPSWTRRRNSFSTSSGFADFG